ncbi:MAG: hypothetical protein WCD12_03245 [Candidatus Binatus sp.]|uniref:hypothetical protein n=1 Tax=Candidatus Binatus sp. TaxID=2811406 RepID=UPI003C74DA36
MLQTTSHIDRRAAFGGLAQAGFRGGVETRQQVEVDRDQLIARRKPGRERGAIREAELNAKTAQARDSSGGERELRAITDQPAS